VASAVYAPVPCTHRDCRWPIGVTTSLQDPPFVMFDAGLVDQPTEVGQQAALQIIMPGDQARTMAALQRELVARYGAPDWTSADGTAMTWHTRGDTIGLFLSGDGLWSVETHELPRSGPPGLAPY
jgi:hypothetical protein